MPGPDLVYSVAGFVVAGLACWVGYAFAFAPPLVAASESRDPARPSTSSKIGPSA
jgi:hypothetical protein